MATTTTKFTIGDTFYTFNPDFGYIRAHVVMAMGIVAVGGNVSMAPSVSYTAVNANGQVPEEDCLTSQEATDAGNAWLAAKSTNMFTSAGL